MKPACGFSLIELIVTLSLLALLATLAMPMLELTRQRQQEQELKAALRDIRRALDAYHQAVREGRIESAIGDPGYPASLDTLTHGMVDRTDPNGRMMYFLRSLPRDPFYPDPREPAAATWNPRSYSSPHDAPAPGSDVFDVHSYSDKTGLNGVPYREW